MPKHHAVKTYRSAEAMLHALTSAVDGGAIATLTATFVSGAETPYPLVRRLGDLQSRSGLSGEEIHTYPCLGSNADRPSRIQSLY